MKKGVKIIAAGAILLALAGIALQCKHFVFAAEDSDFRVRGTTLTSYVGDDTFVTIPEQITVIGEGAFADNTTLASVELPANLQEVLYNAFGNCTALTQVTLPDSVTKVGPGAFRGCSALKMVEIGKNVSSWGSGVFNDCTSLSTLLVDSQNRYLTYYDGALYNGSMSFLYQVLSARTGENYVTPTEVRSIDTYAFWNMQNVKNIKLTTGITSIAASSMTDMGSVENVILPNTVTSIGNRAFANNTSLRQVMIPANVSTIQSNAFSGSANVSILTTRNSYAATFGNEHEIPVIYEALLTTDFNDSNPSGQRKPDLNRTVVVETAPDRNTTSLDSQEEDEEEEEDTDTEDLAAKLDEEAIGRTVIVNGQAMFLMKQQPVYGTAAGSSVSLEETSETESQDAENEEESQSQDTTATDSASQEQNTNAGETSGQQTNNSQTNNNQTNNENSTSVSERRYYMQKNLTNYDISEKINTIGRLAFARSGLTSITIPDSVTTIEYGAFYACEDLAEVEIADSVTSIATKAFADTPWLDNWLAQESEDDSFLIVGDGILLAYRGTATQVEIPDSVKQIGSEVFKGNNRLRTVVIPDSVTRIGADAFRNCSNLSSVSGGEGLTTIVRGAFYGTDVSEDSIIQK